MNLKLNTVLLSGKDIERMITMSEVIQVVEEAFREKGLGRVQCPPKIYLYYEKYNGDLRVMPAFLEGLNISGVKIVNVHPDNRRYNLPSIMATIVIVDPKTGFPLSIMDGTMITSMRTGAVAGVATKYMGRKDSKTLGLVGAGVQGRYQLMAALEVLRLEEVYVYDIDEKVKLNFVNEMSIKYPNVKFIAVESEREAVEGMDVIATTTPTRFPHVKAEWIAPGTHINAIGADAPGKQELDPQILKNSRIIVDDMEQAIHSGEVNVPISKGIISKEDICGELSDLIIGKVKGRISEDEVTIFDSTGVAIADIATADLVYKKAKELNIGMNMNLISL
ncbi:MAG: alanine dehydrogenase [Nitrososphaerota archaeon]|nr:alanine dehydrogenase [Nitrososphaerales archaeon]MDW8044626.1 alanine dehydrogenase [Nitrososphaerota archaeon]